MAMAIEYSDVEEVLSLYNQKDPHSSPNTAITFYKSSNVKLILA
jgi:hypothetical protein